MSDVTLTKSKRKTAEIYSAMANQLIADIELLEVKIEADAQESERIKAETQVIKAHTELTLSRLEAQLARWVE